MPFYCWTIYNTNKDYIYLLLSFAFLIVVLTGLLLSNLQMKTLLFKLLSSPFLIVVLILLVHLQIKALHPTFVHPFLIYCFPAIIWNLQMKTLLYTLLSAPFLIWSPWYRWLIFKWRLYIIYIAVPTPNHHPSAHPIYNKLSMSYYCRIFYNLRL